MGQNAKRIHGSLTAGDRIGGLLEERGEHTTGWRMTQRHFQSSEGRSRVLKGYSVLQLRTERAENVHVAFTGSSKGVLSCFTQEEWRRFQFTTTVAECVYLRPLVLGWTSGHPILLGTEDTSVSDTSANQAIGNRVWL